MGVVNLATERVMLAVLLAPMMFGQEPLLLIKRQRKEAQIPLKGEGLKEVKENVRAQVRDLCVEPKVAIE